LNPLSNPCRTLCVAPPLYPRQATQPARLDGGRLPARGAPITLVAKQGNREPAEPALGERGAAHAEEALPAPGGNSSAAFLWPFLAYPKKDRPTYDRRGLKWCGSRLWLLSNRGLVLASIEPDQSWPGMWRVRLPDGYLTDMVNLSRAKDAAGSLALGVLNRPGGRMSGRRSRSKGARTERSIVNALQANGIAAVRVPLSGAVGGRFAGRHCTAADGPRPLRRAEGPGRWVSRTILLAQSA
jgi:hypothetical protein